MYLHILLEKKGDYAEAVRYVSRLDFGLVSTALENVWKCMLYNIQ